MRGKGVALPSRPTGVRASHTATTCFLGRGAQTPRERVFMEPGEACGRSAKAGLLQALEDSQPGAHASAAGPLAPHRSVPSARGDGSGFRRFTLECSSRHRAPPSLHAVQSSLTEAAPTASVALALVVVTPGRALLRWPSLGRVGPEGLGSNRSVSLASTLSSAE